MAKKFPTAWIAGGLVLALVLIAPSALAQEASLPPYEVSLAQVSHDEDCERSDYPEIVFFLCRADLTAWYFTKAELEAHPGYIRRTLVERDGALHMDTAMHSDGSDTQQPAFQSWAARVAASIGQ